MAILGFLRAEWLKMRRSTLLPMHLAVPLLGCVVFLAYYLVSNWSAQTQVLAFLQAVGVCYPLMVSVVCAKSVELEEGNHFQTFLGVAQRKGTALLAKGLSLYLLGFGAVVAVMALFGLGHALEGKHVLDLSGYVGMAVFMWLCSLALYIEHLFLNLRFSKSFSMGLGAAELLLSALMLTGLGDGRWYFFPCAWAARGSQLMYVYLTEPRAQPLMLIELQSFALVALFITSALCGIMMVWIHYYEGRGCHD